MGIGYLLLYVALAVVALWLVAEVLLQNRAPVHWRVLALAGFLGVAVGMGLDSVVVIGVGAGLFAVGQAFVTLSVKRGYQNGWSLRKADGSLPGPLAKVPLLGALTGGAAVTAAATAKEKRVGEVSAVEETPAPAVAPMPEPAAEEAPEVEQTAAFEMQELAQDGVYAPSYYEQPQTAQPQDPYAPAYQPGYDQQQWQTQQQPAYAYDQQSYGGYPQQQQDPYGGYQQPQDPYQGYQQQAWDPNAQQHQQHDQHRQQHEHQQHDQQQHDQQQWQPQPDQHGQGIPQQPAYDQNYGYQQQNTWHQG
ncbi:hypothetical protein [Streptomyces sp. CBMA123]|uniref:hypothetical protein n=1 Tax=Streptomyces sp. CBMA123 TaxID=1896313 RepID=UPI001661C1B2|nr:hypothetical protein [Streptomyces sp. CBMA123]MBD0690129.1 hypothetical protein [Streptomyces sp. CBMA123]